MRFNFGKNEIFHIFCSLFFLLVSWKFKIFVFILISGLFFLLSIRKILINKNYFLLIITILISIIIIEILSPHIPTYRNKLSATYFDEKSTYTQKSYRDYIKGLGFVPSSGSYSSRKLSSKNNEIYDVILI